MIEIALTRDELRLAAHGACDRQIDALLKGRRDQFQPPDPWKNHILGSLAEAAVAKAYDRWWNPFYEEVSKIPADVGKRGQVRAQPRAGGPLIVRKRDKDDHAFMLVEVHLLPTFRIIGWIWGRDAKRDEWKVAAQGDKPEAWFVPQSGLRPAELPQAA